MEKFFVIKDMQRFFPNLQRMGLFQLEPDYFDLM